MNIKCASKWDLQIIGISFQAFSGTLFLSLMICSFKTCTSRACLKKAFCKMCVTVCGRCCLNEGGVAGYVNRMKVKYAAKWGVQIAGMIFQTRSRTHIHLPAGSSVSIRLLLCSSLRRNRFHYPLLLFRSSS